MSIRLIAVTLGILTLALSSGCHSCGKCHRWFGRKNCNTCPPACNGTVPAVPTTAVPPPATNGLGSTPATPPPAAAYQ